MEQQKDSNESHKEAFAEEEVARVYPRTESRYDRRQLIQQQAEAYSPGARQPNQT